MKSMIIIYISIFICCTLAENDTPILQDEGTNNVLPTPTEGDAGETNTVADGSTTLPTGLLNWIHTGSNMMKKKLSFGADTLNKVLDIGNNAAQTAAQFGSDASNRATEYAKNGVDLATSLGINGIDGGAGIAHQVLGMADQIPVLRIISGVGKAGVNAASGLGKNVLNAANRFEGRKLGFLNNIVQRGSNALSNLSNAGTSFGQSLVTGSTNAIMGGIDTGLDVMNRIMDGITSLTSAGNSLSNSVTG